MRIHSNQIESAYDSLIAMVKTIESGFDKDLYEEILHASNEVFDRNECAKDYFQFDVILPSSRTHVLRLYKQIYQFGSDLEHMFYSVNGAETKVFTRNNADPLTLGVVLSVDSLREIPNNELYRLNGALKRAIRIIQIQKSRGCHD